MDFPAYLLRAHIDYTTAGIAPKRKRHGYGWTAALAIIAAAVVWMGWR